MKQKHPLQILIVHESAVIRNILQEYLLTDHPDAETSFSFSPEDTEKLLENKKYDLVFSGLEMEKTDAYAVHSRMKKSLCNPQTPLAVMTSSDTPAQRSILAQRGIRHILPLPCTSIQFRELIYRIFNPESNTGRTFYTMPESRALIYTEDRELAAEIINISSDSIICGLEWSGERHPLTKARSVLLQFPADYGKASTISIRGELLGIKDSIRLHTDHPGRLRVNWKVVWKRFELQAATKRPLQFYLRENRGAEKKTEKDAKADTALIRENESLKTALEIQTSEKEKLLQKISRLKKNISNLEKSQAEMNARRADSRLVSEAALPTQDSRKLSIFQKVIADNLTIRKK